MGDYSYIGKGKVYLSKRGTNKLRFVGNCEKVELSFTEETKELKDFTQAGGGVSNSVSRIDKVELGLNLFDYSPENLAFAMYGENAVLSAGSVAAESHILYQNHLTKLNYSHVSNVGVTDTVSGTTYQQDVDYEVTNAGIFILETGNIANGSDVTVDYDYGASNVIHALMNSGDEYQFVFDGLNEAQSGKKVVLEVYRVKFTPAASLSFLSEDFASIEVTGTALSDNSIIGSGISKYFKVEMEQ